MKPKTKQTRPNSAKKNARLSCLKVTIVEFVKKKRRRNWLHIPLKKNSRLQCVANKNFPAEGKIPTPPPAYLMVAPFIIDDIEF